MKDKIKIKKKVKLRDFSRFSADFNRIFQKMIKRRMESFIEQKNLLSPSQYGFRKAHSTQHTILDIVNAIQTNMDTQLFPCGVFIDFKKLLILLIIISYCINLITMAFVEC